MDCGILKAVRNNRRTQMAPVKINYFLLFNGHFFKNDHFRAKVVIDSNTHFVNLCISHFFKMALQYINDRYFFNQKQLNHES
jgi:hypothetical protein